MSKAQKRTLLVLFALGALYFLLFLFPNAQGAADRNMLAVFEPDEFAQYPHVIRMLTPGKNLAETVFNIIVYRHFYYGYPFYLLSALVLLPLRLTNTLTSTPWVMLTLRQMISVLPMIVAILFLVYLQTRFRNLWSSLILSALLLSVPAVVRNDMWWHPDSLTILWIVLTFFFLDRDDLSFGKDFLLAAVACGLAVGTKLIGLFFFLAIPIYIAWGLISRKINLRRAVIAAVVFVALMVLTVVLSNPLLLHPEGRARILATQQRQQVAMSFGWAVAYAKGPASWFEIIVEYYGQWFFIALAFVAAFLGALRSSRRLLFTLILAWAVPFALYILFFIAIKPRHFFLPIALPLYSCLAFILPFDGMQPKRSLPGRLLSWGALALIAVQFYANISAGVSQYTEELHRQKTSASLNFYANLERRHLSCLPSGTQLVVYRDVRAYVPPSNRWQVEMKWGLVDYDYISQLKPDLLVLQQQRIKDYTLTDAVENAADPAQMERTYRFYKDAAEGRLEGYRLLMQDDFGMAFARLDRYDLFQAGNESEGKSLIRDIILLVTSKRRAACISRARQLIVVK